MMTMCRYKCVLIVTLLSSLLNTSCSIATEDTRPNILLILLDDVGYNDIGVFNGNQAVSTPSLDEFAQQGVRFTRHYAEVVCAPARAALLTGLFPSRLGYRNTPLGISPQVPTIPKVLKEVGYTTHFVGKWLMWGGPDARPTKQGFDSYFGFRSSAHIGGDRNQRRFEKVFPPDQDPWIETENTWQQYKGHLSDLLAENVVGNIQAFQKGPPWFIAYWPLAVHYPICPAEWAAKQYPDTPKGRYLAYLHQLDTNVGKALSALDDSDQLDNTMVIILSDNGGTNLQTDNNAPFTGYKGQFLEGSMRTPLMVRWPSAWPSGVTIGDTVAIQDIFPTIANAAKANTSQPIDGFDLSALVAGEPLPLRALYWEKFYRDHFAFSMLTADGRWRLGASLPRYPEPSVDPRPDETPPELYDLNDDPLGSRDVSKVYPEVTSGLITEYERWHLEVRRLKLGYLPSEKARGELVGDDFQRVPMRGGYTFALGVSRPAGVDAEHGVIAEQVGLWKLSSLSGQRVELEFGGQVLEATMPQGNSCNAIAFSLKYRPMIGRSLNAAVSISLNVNGEKSTDFTGNVSHSDLAYKFKPTVILPDSEFSRHTSVSEPIVFNTVVKANTPLTFDLLDKMVCPDS